MNIYLQNALDLIQRTFPHLHGMAGFIMLIGGLTLGSGALYLFTKLKEFLVVFIAAMLYVVPFLLSGL